MPLLCETEHKESRDPLCVNERKQVYFCIVHNNFSWSSFIFSSAYFKSV